MCDLKFSFPPKTKLHIYFFSDIQNFSDVYLFIIFVEVPSQAVLRHLQEREKIKFIKTYKNTISDKIQSNDWP